jgi:hypothetical protein
VERENHQLPLATEAEGEPAGVTPGNVAQVGAVAVGAPGVGEWGPQGLSEKAKLGAMGMAGKGEDGAFLESFIQKIGDEKKGEVEIAGTVFAGDGLRKH